MIKFYNLFIVFEAFFSFRQYWVQFSDLSDCFAACPFAAHPPWPGGGTIAAGNRDRSRNLMQEKCYSSPLGRLRPGQRVLSFAVTRTLPALFACTLPCTPSVYNLYYFSFRRKLFFIVFGMPFSSIFKILDRIWLPCWLQLGIILHNFCMPFSSIDLGCLRQ